jgi:hypothetical protein
MAAKKKSDGSWAAGFFTPKQTAAFESVVEADLRGRGLEFEMGPGAVHVTRGREKTPAGLTNLAQDCKRLAQSKWKARVAFHFDALFETFDTQDDLEKRAKRFDDVADLLKVRMHSQVWLDNVDPKQTFYVEAAPSLVMVLVFDLPKAVIGVTPSQAKSWKKTKQKLFDLGIANVEREGLLPVTDVKLDYGLRAIGLDNESFFTATHGFFHERYLDDKPKRGTLVAMPRRHTAIFHPVAGPKSEKAIRPILEMASGFYQEGPGEASPFLYHVVNGVFSMIEMEFTKRDVKLHYPKSLARALS